MHAALSLVLTLFGVAVHFVAMEAHFLAAVQVIVYAGAIVVLFLFVIMLLGVDQAEDLRTERLPDPAPTGRRARVSAWSGCSSRPSWPARDTEPLAVGSGLASPGRPAPVADVDLADHDANIRQLSFNLFSDNVFVFELTSVLLIVAVAATVVLTRRERSRAAAEAEPVES